MLQKVDLALIALSFHHHIMSVVAATSQSLYAKVIQFCHLLATHAVRIIKFILDYRVEQIGKCPSSTYLVCTSSLSTVLNMNKCGETHPHQASNLPQPQLPLINCSASLNLYFSSFLCASSCQNPLSTLLTRGSKQTMSIASQHLPREQPPSACKCRVQSSLYPPCATCVFALLTDIRDVLTDGSIKE